MQTEEKGLMSQGMGQNNDTEDYGVRASSGRFLFPAIALAAIALSLYCFNDARAPVPVPGIVIKPGQSPATVNDVTALNASSRSPALSARQHTVTLDIDTEIGKLRTEFYADKASTVIADMVELVRSGYFNSDTVIEVRPGLGFVISKIGNGVKSYHHKDQPTGLTSKRGSIAISKTTASTSYLNNLFIGFQTQPDLERHYTVIGQVLEGLDRFEQSLPGVRHKVIGFSVEDEELKSTAKSPDRGPNPRT